VGNTALARGGKQRKQRGETLLPRSLVGFPGGSLAVRGSAPPTTRGLPSPSSSAVGVPLALAGAADTAVARISTSRLAPLSLDDVDVLGGDDRALPRNKWEVEGARYKFIKPIQHGRRPRKRKMLRLAGERAADW
jgi:hypothetical protein